MNIIAPKVVPGPKPARGQLESLLAVARPTIIVLRLFNEHRMRPVGFGQRHLVAGENVPAKAIKIAISIDVSEVSAVGIRRIIVEVHIYCL